MRYLLAILTNGRHDCLERTLAAYAEFLSPMPSALFVWDDGGADRIARTRELVSEAFPLLEVFHGSGREPVGRCAAHGWCWHAIAGSWCDWAFMVEDDVVLLRPLDLRALARVIEAEPTLEQLALVRCPWGAEIEHGGYIAQFPWKYERRRTVTPSPPVEIHEWIASTVDWTNSPALFPTRLAREVEWPSEPGCELELGPRIRALRPDAVSGYWGWGEPWVAHIGVERATGGHGY